MFASRVTKTIPVPFDPPHEVTIQKLSGRHLASAHNAFMSELFNSVRERGGAAVQKEMQQLFKPDPVAPADADAAAPSVEAAAEIAKVKADPLNGYDKHALIRYGLKAWTYDVDLKEETLKATVEDIDPDGVDFLATEIMRLTKPALFQDETEAAVAQKNG